MKGTSQKRIGPSSGQDAANDGATYAVPIFDQASKAVTVDALAPDSRIVAPKLRQTLVDVSVIIPSYNRAWSLPRAIDSCRGTKCRTEIVVIDDGSTDATWAWLEHQPGIVARRQANQGQTWAVNLGLSIARGRYLRILDSDDWLEPGVIDRHFEAAEATGADLVYSRVDMYNEESKDTYRFPDTPLWDDFMAEHLGEGPGLQRLGMQFRRSLFATIRCRPEFSLREDRALVLEIGLQNPRLLAVPGCAGYWVQHGSQMHTGKSGLSAIVSSWELLSVFQRTLVVLEQRNQLTARRRRAAARTLWLVAHWVGYGLPHDAAAVAAWVYRLDPNFDPPERGAVGWCYRHLGFGVTEWLMRVRRCLLSPFRPAAKPQLGPMPG